MSDVTYTVTGDAGDLSGWTPETLADALRAPLADVGVEVECNPRQSGSGGLPSDADDSLRERVQHIVESVVAG